MGNRPVVAEGERAAMVTGLLPGEPVFVLRARDTFTSDIIREWLKRAEYGLSPERVEGVYADLGEIIRWRQEHRAAVRDPD